ncbi:MAG: tRNA preQ1(34) S-adenosylmethionine ribosyltransferase-isomerase QueA [Candidatus Andersenbacteria bacterium]|nr:tRNA preQ1(34) S-adenosylmethionine ribosyltransferase-isomerase QueA [Candidatus Andersenbacteria bacterium]
MFDYTLPPELIAHEPARERDSSRLFIYDTASDTVSFDTFGHLAHYLPQNSFLVINDTKVVPAHIEVRKETGGKVELLLLLNEWRPGDVTVRCLSDRKITIGQVLTGSQGLTFTVKGQQENVFEIAPNMPVADLLLLLEVIGTTPVPRYLQPIPLNEQAARKRYQSIFAQKPASVAAPTASLHFTPAVFKSLDQQHIPQATVTLHVGLGTFAPVTSQQFADKKLHREFVAISPEEAMSINGWKAGGKKLVAVGTTATRVLESRSENGQVTAGEGFTDIFIIPGYSFQAVDGLITNFHLPNSSLMMLVQALLEHKKAKRGLKELYKIAIQEKFRFYSFGDAMLIL